ncbi:MAG: phenylalanine--tRNA ligase subunit alpha [Nanoarchaeota archaeon]|nr:phenylalanine--tRNA ligase subunit alpha [Nanoarchaeota archaeon]MBU1644461.1 phenylalanine--tRNA ligase subunit alpha [Nanoarchaeota archaeon]MBU1976465.1 phenylalanine--tRNA ligase subunit alpha [Nanoarchaeota archaeon]
MDTDNLVAKLHPLERAVLPILKEETELSAISKKAKLQEIEVMRALQWLENKKILSISIEKKKIVSLDKNGLIYKKEGLPEKEFLAALSEEYKGLNVLTKKSRLSREEVNACLGLLRKKVAIDIKPGEILQVKITEQGQKLLQQDSLEEQFLKKEFPLDLDAIKDIDKYSFDELKKRKDILKVEELKLTTVKLTELGIQLASLDLGGEVVNRLTPGMLKQGTWKDKQFRAYDVEINVPKIDGGRRHPYNEALNIIRKAFLEMGFQEMAGPWVETAFWGMDSMWIAQDHPMREAQDTFYLDKDGDLPDKEFVNKVKAAHENGYNTGSTGHTKKWDPELAKKLILRQHSTATTFRYFYEKKLNCDCKYFYIADNFRNEATDATHLPEFGQAEGFIMGDNLTLADLMGFIKEFYAKLGITKIRFKPTFNPYTEPSMEAHYYNEKMGKWYALINSGIFRPEALAPYGIKKSVIAWGMGSSRIAAILTGKNKLKDLFGPEVDFEWIKKHQRVKTI